MISVTRTPIPGILVQNQQEWTNQLYSLIGEYGSYAQIPDKIKNIVVGKYKNEEIITSLLAMHGGIGKCVYCESIIDIVGFPHIEHFYPKSLFPKYTFKWSNLLLSCAKCNIKKGDTDVKVAFPIVNPSIDNPELFFIFKELRMQISPSSPDPVKSANSIKYCDLNRITLSRSYSDILIGIYEVEERLKQQIFNYGNLAQETAKIRKANQIKESLDSLKMQSEYNKSYAGFLRYIIRGSNTINSCISIINAHSIALGVNNYSIIPTL